MKILEKAGRGVRLSARKGNGAGKQHIAKLKITENFADRPHRRCSAADVAAQDKFSIAP